MTESSTKSALILQTGEPSGAGSAVWVPAQSDEEIFEAHAECLIFVDELGGKSPQGSWTERIKLAMDVRYPRAHDLLSRLTIASKHQREYKKTYGYYHRLERVIIGAQDGRVYNGEEAEDVCMLAKAFGAITVKDSYFKVGNTHGGNGDNHTEVLEEHGCYWRSSNTSTDGQQPEVVYSPKVVARRFARGCKRTGPAPPSFLMINELVSGASPLVRFLVTGGCLDTHNNYPWKIVDSYGSHRSGRSGAINVWHSAITMIDSVFGKEAHRHVPEFQKFIRETWAVQGAATRRHFGCDSSSNNYGYNRTRRDQEDELFDLFDRELTRRKPKKLKNLRAINNNRIDDLWLSEEERKTRKTEKALVKALAKKGEVAA